MALLDETQATSPCSAYDLRGRDAIPSSARNIRRRSGSSARSAICSARGRSARPTRGPGSISASGTCGIRSATASPRDDAAPYVFLPAEGEGLHQIPVGPVHAGIIEPGHFRFTANGETRGAAGAAARLCAQGHRVADGRRDARRRPRSSPGAPPATARSPMPSPSRRPPRPRLQIEAAAARAIYLRALMAELERLANHFGDIGAICNDASFSLMHAQCGILRERVLARRRRLLRPSADDGRDRAGRRRARHRAGRRRAVARAAR